MRRKDREITDPGRIKEILDGCKTCHLAMVDDGQPYVIPLSYAYTLEENTLTLLFHSAKEGRKIDIMQKNNAVCFEMSIEGEPLLAKTTPCNSGYYYSSVQGLGTAHFIEDIDEKCAAMTRLMKHQANYDAEFTPEQVEKVCVFKVESTSFTGKAKPRPEA